MNTTTTLKPQNAMNISSSLALSFSRQHEEPAIILAHIIEDNNHYYLKNDDGYEKNRDVACLRYTLCVGTDYYDRVKQIQSLEGTVNYYVQEIGLQFDFKAYEKAILSLFDKPAIHQDSDDHASGYLEHRAILGMPIETLATFIIDKKQQSLFLNHFNNNQHIDKTIKENFEAFEKNLVPLDTFIEEETFDNISLLNEQLNEKMKKITEISEKITQEV